MQTIKITGEIGWDVTAEQFSREIERLSGDLTIEINSPGGYVYEGIAIHNEIKRYDRGETTTLIVAQASSMASYIATAGDKRKAFANAVFMIHNARMGIYGDQNHMREAANHIEGLSGLMKKNYVSVSGKSEDEITELMNKDSFFYGDEILENGFVHELISLEDEEELIGKVSAVAVATERYKDVWKKMQENAENENIEKAVAIAKTILGENPASAKIETKLTGEHSMEYTKESVKALTDNHAEALKANTKDVEAAERKRVSDIFALGGTTAFTQKAISDGSTVGDTAIALLKEQKEANTAAATDFEAAGAAANEAGNVESGQEELDAEGQANKDADDALANLNYKGDK